MPVGTSKSSAAPWLISRTSHHAKYGKPGFPEKRCKQKLASQIPKHTLPAVHEGRQNCDRPGLVFKFALANAHGSTVSLRAEKPRSKSTHSTGTPATHSSSFHWSTFTFFFPQNNYEASAHGKGKHQETNPHTTNYKRLDAQNPSTHPELPVAVKKWLSISAAESGAHVRREPSPFCGNLYTRH